MAKPSPKADILLVDDQSANLLALESVLDDLGQNLVQAHSGEEALRLLADHDFAVVLMDVRMPGLDGFETAKLVRSQERSRHTPIIFITAYDDDRFSVEQAYALGAVDFLTKPFLPAVLRTKVAVFVELFQKTEQVKHQAEELRHLERQEFQSKLAEEDARLRQAEERFRLFMENVKEYAVFMLDPEGRVVDWNLGAEHVLGYGDEVLGQPFATFFPPDDRQAGIPEHELRRAAETGRASDDRWHVRKDGTYFWATGTTTAMRDEQGTLKGFTKVLRDSTERKRFDEELQNRNEALQEADRRKDEFLAVLAHELRNPLAPIFNALSVLAQEGLPAEMQREAHLVMDRQVRQLTRLVDELLDVSRITRGKIQLKKQAVELQVIVENAVQTCRPLIDAHRHALTVSQPANPIWLDADPTRLEQVVVNLLNNAAKYSQDEGRITITTSQEGDEAVLRVQDAGIGIPPELLPDVFDLFRQADRSLDRSHGGLGVGLTLVRRLVELHDGVVEAQSEGIGQGSQFVVRLPVSAEAPQSTWADRTVQPPPASEHPLRLLVVDDNVDAAESLRMVLTMGGNQVATAHTGDTALQTAKEYRPDAILMDIGLPGLNGYQVAERLRETPDLKGVVLIAITGYGQEDDRQRSKQAGFDYHMVKPVDPQQLQQLLTMLSKKRR
jgi:PAS domain S-box-containing protein